MAIPKGYGAFVAVDREPNNDWGQSSQIWAFVYPKIGQFWVRHADHIRVDGGHIFEVFEEFFDTEGVKIGQPPKVGGFENLRVAANPRGLAFVSQLRFLLALLWQSQMPPERAD